MTSELLLPLLALGTLFAVIIFALVSKFRTEKRLEDANAPKTSLAEDGPAA